MVILVAQVVELVEQLVVVVQVVLAQQIKVMLVVAFLVLLLQQTKRLVQVAVELVGLVLVQLPLTLEKQVVLV
jgi:hypothetical protein